MYKKLFWSGIILFVGAKSYNLFTRWLFDY